MANTKKYVSLAKLGLYDQKIKKVITDGDANALKEAKLYADGLAVNYEAAGAAATVQGKLDEEVTRAKAREDEIAGLVATAQGEVDALETLVGKLPEGTTAKDVVDYVNVKTAGIATDAALEELQNQLSGVQEVVETIEGDYLKTADKTELANAIDAEKQRAEGIEGGLRTDVDAIKGDHLKAQDKADLQGGIDANAEAIEAIEADYLKAADKTELQGKIDAKVAQSDYDAKMEEIDGGIDGLQTQINTIMNNPDAEGAINSINEFTQYVADHGTIADGFRADIDKNKEDIAAMDTAYKAADSLLSGRLDTLEAIDHEAYVAADTALKNELTTEIGKKADSSVVTAQGEAITALQGEDTAIKGRLDDIEAQLGDGEGSVSDQIADAKQEAIDAAAADATTKANAAQAAAIAKAEELNTAMDERMDVVEAKAHEHANKAELDLIVAGDKAKWDAAAAKAHEHSNLSVLEGITSAKVTEWDKVSGKAEQTALQGEIDRATAAEQALGARIDEFVEVSEAEVLALFQQ